jgi:hypothetical protein
MIDAVHENGGLVYMDGANMNAQVGLTNPASIGADVCHLNLHKTFAIPHGGGGPGMGPIAVTKALADYLPTHPVVKTGGAKGTTAVAAAPYGSASILSISHAYCRMLGAEGLTMSTKFAILNANYIAAALKKYYNVLYTGTNGCNLDNYVQPFQLHRISVASQCAVGGTGVDGHGYGFVVVWFASFRRQPCAGNVNLYALQNPMTPAMNQPKHTFFRHNAREDDQGRQGALGLHSASRQGWNSPSGLIAN